jgi:hypothetical protein
LSFAVNSVSSGAEFHLDFRPVFFRFPDDHNAQSTRRSAAFAEAWERHRDIQNSLANPPSSSTVRSPTPPNSVVTAGIGFKPRVPMGSAIAKFTSSFITTTVQ